MRIRAITPIRVGATELARRQRRYRRLSPAAIEVTLVDLEDGPDVPRALETEDDVRRSERLVVAEARRTSAVPNGTKFRRNKASVTLPRNSSAIAVPSGFPCSSILSAGL